MQKQKQTILLLGGTGAMGVYLAPELLAMGYDVHITSRSSHESDKPGITYLTGNAKDIDFLREVLKNDYAAIVDFMIYKTEEFRGRYLELLDASPHYLFVSSYRVYGDNNGKPITEDSPRLLDSVKDEEYLKTDEYALTKARQENILRESGRKNWTILRPAITYSRERFQLGTLEAADFVRRAINGKTVIFPKQMLKKHATLSWAGDVAKLISRLILNDQAMGEAYTVSTSEHHTWQEIMNYYKDILGMQVKLVELEQYQEIIGGPYQIKYDRMLDRIVDNAKALAATGMSQRDFMPLKKGLKMELEQFTANPTFRGVNAGRERKTDALVNAEPAVTPSPLKRKLQTAKRLWAEKKLLSTICKKVRQVFKP